MTQQRRILGQATMRPWRRASEESGHAVTFAVSGEMARRVAEIEQSIRQLRLMRACLQVL